MSTGSYVSLNTCLSTTPKSSAPYFLTLPPLKEWECQIVTEERLKFLFENGISELYTCGFRFHSGRNMITIDGKTRPIYEWNTHTGYYDDRIYDIELRNYYG